MIRFPISNPKSVTLAATTGMSAWAAAGFTTDPHHLALVAVSTLGGMAVPHNPSTQPNVLPESHIVTPYANNMEQR